MKRLLWDWLFLKSSLHLLNNENSDGGRLILNYFKVANLHEPSLAGNVFSSRKVHMSLFAFSCNDGFLPQCKRTTFLKNASCCPSTELENIFNFIYRHSRKLFSPHYWQKVALLDYYIILKVVIPSQSCIQVYYLLLFTVNKPKQHPEAGLDLHAN